MLARGLGLGLGRGLGRGHAWRGLLSAGDAVRAFAQPATRVKTKATSAQLRESDQELLETQSFNFETEARKMIKKMETAVKPMVPLNEEFSVALSNPDELTVLTSRGKHTVTLNREKETLLFVSYMSGHHNYYFEPSQRVWLSNKDNHDLRGLFIRDLMRHHNGFPELD